jgi:hypothetical protein
MEGVLRCTVWRTLRTITAALVGGENLNFAVPINDARKLLNVPATQALLAFPNEPENEPEGHAAAQDPIILDEDGATGFAEMFAVEPACAGLTLMRKWSDGGHWIISVGTMHGRNDPDERIFLSWYHLAHYTTKESDCTIGGVRKQCQDVDTIRSMRVIAILRQLSRNREGGPSAGVVVKWATIPRVIV